MTFNKPSGKHVFVDGEEIPFPLLNNPDYFKEIMSDCIVGSGATILDVVVRKFEPQGFTMAFVLAESHATVHTYPEHGVYMMDMFTCGDVDPEPIINEIFNHMPPHVHQVSVKNRGKECESA